MFKPRWKGNFGWVTTQQHSSAASFPPALSINTDISAVRTSVDPVMPLRPSHRRSGVWERKQALLAQNECTVYSIWKLIKEDNKEKKHIMSLCCIVLCRLHTESWTINGQWHVMIINSRSSYLIFKEYHYRWRNKSQLLFNMHDLHSISTIHYKFKYINIPPPYAWGGLATSYNY